MKAARQTKLKLRKGFHNAPLVYKVLSIDLLSAKDKSVVAKQLVKLTNPDHAKRLVGVGSVWGYKPVSLFPPEAGVVLYKGVQVALFFKRTTEDVVPLPCDPIPYGALENPDDVWIRFDMLGKSSRQMYSDVRDELKDCQSQMNQLQAELNAADRIHQADQQTIATMRGKLKKGTK